MTKFLLIGAGGHARAIAETIVQQGDYIGTYVDPKPSEWLNATRIETDEEALAEAGPLAVMGIGGQTPDALKRRLELFAEYELSAFNFPPIAFASAVVSDDASIGHGSQIFAHAYVGPDAIIQSAAIINTGAIVEHGAIIGEGAHIAPGAIVLGGATVDNYAMIGAGAVVLPGTTIGAGTLLPALKRSNP